MINIDDMSRDWYGEPLIYSHAEEEMQNISDLLGMRVFVYWNLHKKVFSIKAMEGESKGRVIAYASNLCLENAQSKVSEAGRQRVIREKCKNVHAGILGYLTDRPINASKVLRYNPYETPTFVIDGTEAWMGGDVLMTSESAGGALRPVCYV